MYLVGLLAAIGASLTWSFSSTLWRKQTILVGSTQLNLLKNILATIFFLPIFLSLPWLIELRPICLLLISGAVGIGFGDTFYFRALNLLGTRRTLTIEAISPVLAFFFSSTLMNESLPSRSWLGSLLVVISVSIVSQQAPPVSSFKQKLKNSDQVKGFLYALASSFCGVVGALISRFVLLEGNLLPLQTSAIRLLGGIMISFPVFICFFNRSLAGVKFSRIKFPLILVATLLGTNLGLILQQVVFQKLPLSVGVTLLSTSPLISIFFSKSEGDKPGKNGVLASILSLLGISIVVTH